MSKTRRWSHILFLALPLILTLVGLVGGPARALLTSEDDLRNPAEAPFAVITAWSTRQELGQQNELPQYMPDFLDLINGPSEGLLGYDYPPDFPNAKARVINANDFPNVLWAARSYRSTVQGVHKYGEYYFAPLSNVINYSSHVRLNVFCYRGLWISRVCGNFTLQPFVADTALTVPNVSVPCLGGSVTLQARLIGVVSQDGLPGRALHFSVNGQLVGTATTDDDGYASVPYNAPPQAAGLVVQVTFDGEECYGASTESTTIGVQQVSSTIQVPAATGICHEPVQINARLLADGVGVAGEPLIIQVGSESYPQVNTGPDGWAHVDYTPTAAGPVTIQVTYAGGSCFGGSVGIGTLSVRKQNTTLSVPDVTAGCHDGTTLSATLKDESGNPIAGESLSLSVNGQVFTQSTGPDGTIRVPLTAPDIGTYPISATFTGDDCYAASTGAGTLTVIQEIPTLTYTGDKTGDATDSTTLSALLVDDDTPPDAVVGRTVTFTLSGAGGTRSYDGVTDGSGKVSTSPVLDLPAGSYTLTVSFAGDVCYHGASLTLTYEVKHDPTALTCQSDSGAQYSDPTTLAAVLKDDSGRPLAGQTVSFQLGDQSATATTDQNGLASTTLILNQGAGSYTLAITFAGDAYYAASQTTCPYTISRENATIAETNDDVVRCDPTNNDAGAVTLRARITEEQDGSFGNTSLAPVYFIVTDQDGVQQRFPATGYIYPTITGPGVAEVSLSAALPTGIYQVTAYVGDNPYYVAPPSNAGSIVVFCPEAGFVTGGGTIALPGGGKGSFGLEVKYLPGDRLQGNLQYVDHSTRMDVHSVSLDWLVITRTPRGKRADFSGTAVVKATGQRVKMRVEVEDNGEPGTNDTFHIVLGSGYEAAGPDRAQNILSGGNIQIHSQAP